VAAGALAMLCAVDCLAAFGLVELSSAIRLVCQPKNSMTDAVMILCVEDLMFFSVRFATATTLAKLDSGFKGDVANIF
jgi:hypothetical protein